MRQSVNGRLDRMAMLLRPLGRISSSLERIAAAMERGPSSAPPPPVVRASSSFPHSISIHPFHQAHIAQCHSRTLRCPIPPWRASQNYQRREKEINFFCLNIFNLIFHLYFFFINYCLLLIFLFDKIQRNFTNKYF